MFVSYSIKNNWLLMYILALLLFNNPLLFAALSKDSEKIQSEIEAIDVQLEYLKIKVSDNKKKSRSLEKRIQNKKQDIKDLGSQIEQLAKNEADIKFQIQKLEDENADSKKQLKELLNRFKKRLVQLHRIRQGTLVSSVIFAKDLNTFLNRYQMVKYLLESDRAVIEELKTREEKVKRIGEKLMEKNRALEAGREEITRKQRLLAREQANLNAMLNAVLIEKKVFLKRERDLAASRKQLEKEIEKVSKLTSNPEFEKELAITADSVAVNKSQDLSSKANLVVDAKPANGNYLLDETNVKLSGSQDFLWPIEKRLREEVIEKGGDNSNAILIKPVADAEILASAKGKVLYKGFIGGLGDVVILGHHKGFSTVYARLDNVWVGLNEIVEKGSVIGKIDGGGSNGALHFEIRFGGKKMSPLSYLPK